jgi:hypothetical protein
MEQSKQDEYYQMAIDWATNFIETKEPLINYKCFDGSICDNSHYTLGIWILRLKEPGYSEKRASFVKIKKFKDWYNEKEKI